MVIHRFLQSPSAWCLVRDYAFLFNCQKGLFNRFGKGSVKAFFPNNRHKQPGGFKTPYTIIASVYCSKYPLRALSFGYEENR